MKVGKKLTTCYSIVGEHPSTTTRTAASENHVTQIVPMKTGNSTTDQIYHSKIAYNVPMYCIIAVLFKLIKRHTLMEDLEALGENTKLRFNNNNIYFCAAIKIIIKHRY